MNLQSKINKKTFLLAKLMKKSYCILLNIYKFLLHPKKIREKFSNNLD
jgi:hypothetical protein